MTCQKDISGIEQKIISLYAKGMTTRQISDTIEDIYGVEVSDASTDGRNFAVAGGVAQAVVNVIKRDHPDSMRLP